MSQDINYVAQANQTVSELAAKVKEKNLQLEKLEQVYKNKIRALDEYFTDLQKNYPLPIGVQKEGLRSLEELVPPKCSHCNEIIKSDKYILIPRGYKAEIPDSPTDLPSALPPQPTHSTLTKPHKKNKKVSCSFCKELGHSRKDCPTKLSQQIS
ncbi:BA75_04896T0 [Komagataella pastoris]|uniref:BA75_04896T0 n=1 Tax=Komagataella pastoris TaxID=4922 RepID=A0A1B2JJ87_PICPA|nr:BA75_04896T0 [Komagataella pastoris]